MMRWLRHVAPSSLGPHAWPFRFFPSPYYACYTVATHWLLNGWLPAKQYYLLSALIIYYSDWLKKWWINQISPDSSHGSPIPCVDQGLPQVHTLHFVYSTWSRLDPDDRPHWQQPTSHLTILYTLSSNSIIQYSNHSPIIQLLCSWLCSSAIVPSFADCFTDTC